MSRLSIFSFNTLHLGTSDLIRLATVLMISLGVVASAEALVRLDGSPKALPFSSTDQGTVFDYLLRFRPKTDFFFIGSSQCKCNVSPYDFEAQWRGLTGEEVRAFNGGINGANPSTLGPIYDQLGRALNIVTLVILISPDDLYAGEDKQVTGSYGLDFLAGRLPPGEKLLMNLYLFRYRRQYRDLQYQYYVLTEGLPHSDLSLRLGPHGKGWGPTTGRLVPFGAQGFETVTQRDLPRESSFYPQAIRDLEQNIRTAQRRGRRVVLVVPPHPPRYEEFSSGYGTMFYVRGKVVLVLPPYPPDHVKRAVGTAAMWSEFDRILQRITKETGALVIDHHDLPEFGDDQFADYHHLLNHSARDYSRVLARALAEGLRQTETNAPGARPKVPVQGTIP